MTAESSFGAKALALAAYCARPRLVLAGAVLLLLLSIPLMIGPSGPLVLLFAVVLFAAHRLSRSVKSPVPWGALRN